MEGATIQQVMRETIFEAIPNATTRARELGVAHLLPPWFDAWFARCIQRDPNGRLANATEAFRELERLRAPNPIAVTAPPATMAISAEDATAPTDPLAPPVRPTPGAMLSARGFETQTALATETPRPSRALLPVLGALCAVFAIGGAAALYFHLKKPPVPPTTANDAPPKTEDPPLPSAFDPTAPLPAPSGKTRTPQGLVPVSAEPFNRTAAATALGAVDVQSCKQDGGPTGAGHAQCNFEITGKVSACTLSAPYHGTSTGECIIKKYKTVKVPPFEGTARVSVGKAFLVR